MNNDDLAALSRLPVNHVALILGDGKSKPKEELNPEQALTYLARLMGMGEKERDLALRTILEKLPIWQAAAQQKEVSA